MRVWVYPERTFEELGAERYQLSWEELRASAEGKDEIDHDSDIVSRYENFSDKNSAMKKGREVADKSFYGCASVTRQVVDWFVEGDRVAEWVNTSEVEVID